MKGFQCSSALLVQPNCLWEAGPSWPWVPRGSEHRLGTPQGFAPCCWLCLCLLYLTFYRPWRSLCTGVNLGEYSLGFCQLFLECPVQCCLQRNRLRSDPVPEQTIQLMARKIEMPDPRKNTWEQHSLILSSSDGISEDEYAARAVCAASAVHQADQACRRAISEAMQDAKGKNVLPSEMKSLAEELNKLKAEFLEDLRQGKTLKTQYSDPATSIISSFQQEATKVVNKYILK
uniref:Uncharacterized protein n=1 Tax=Zonotrichia albicollis TaxID=44394 RepID=A0A8D2QC17_ZONAL